MSRDPYRTPMLWTSGSNAGFCGSNVKPWLPVNTDYTYSSVEVSLLAVNTTRYKTYIAQFNDVKFSCQYPATN